MPSIANKLTQHKRDRFFQLMEKANIDPGREPQPRGITISTRGFFSLKLTLQKLLNEHKVGERRIQRMCGCSSPDFECSLEEMRDAMALLPELSVPKGRCQL